MKKRILSFLLAAVLAVSLLVLPAGAAGQDTVTFSDVQDSSTAMAVECLRLLGVLDGYQDGTFRPNAVLTRAQFCKMAVYAMNGGDELGRYRTVTVFPDVKPSHWAVAYINMAAKGKSIIAGYADGRFHPDQTVTVGQAVTILVRLLGYKDENMGGIWPESYMAEAAAIGLTDGVSTNGYAALTRGQAALLFLNLLRADTLEGGSYLSTIGQTRKDEVLVTSSATGPDGKDTAMQLGTDDTVYQLANGKVSNGVLNGRKGTLLLNKQGKVLTFVPDAVGSSKTVTLSTAKATQITDITGAKYTVKSDTPAYYNGQQKSWGEVYSWLNAGTSVTLYLGASGGVEYVFVGGGTSASAAVIVYDQGSTKGFDSLAGGSTGYAIYKNGVKATSGDMRKYDVATYSAATNSIRVCDTRVTVYYESCYPNPEEPSKLTALGHEFDVLPTAMESLSAFKPGDQVTLLLSEDNQVAGAVKPGTFGASGNAMGVVKSLSTSSATVDLLCGITVEGAVDLSQSSVDRLEGQLVRVSSAKKGGLSVTGLTGGVSGDLDVSARTMGSRKLADNVMIFRQSSEGLVSVGLSQLDNAVVGKEDMTYAATDWAGRVKVIVLGGELGSTYLYGRATVRTEGSMGVLVEDENGKEPGEEGYIPTYETVTGKRMLTVEYGNGKSIGPFETGNDIRTGAYVGIKTSGSRITALVELTRLKDVSNSAWSGEGAVTVAGRTYTVSSDVVCYNKTTKTWMDLDAAHAYAKEADLYVHNGVVRVIEVD